MIVNANIQYNRKGHDLLDYSSLQLNYSSAMSWVMDDNSNAAVGQYIYLQESEINIENGIKVIYPKGPYIISAIGKNGSILPLSALKIKNDDNILGINSDSILSSSLLFKREVINGENFVTIYGKDNILIDRIHIDNTVIDAGEY